MDKDVTRAIVFDFGGVLMDWDPRYLYSRLFSGDETAMERFLSEIRFYEWNAFQDEGRPFSEAISELSSRFPHYASLIQAYDTHWEESISTPLWETVTILKALHQAGFPLYALSNWSAEKFPLVRRKYDFFDCFEDIVLSGELHAAKPEPRAFTAFLQRVQRPASECLLIDDSTDNVEIALKLGFQVLHFRSPGQLGEDLVHLGLLDSSPLVDK